MIIRSVVGRNTVFATVFLLMLPLAALFTILPVNGLAASGKTLAVMPFENNAFTDPAAFEPLSKGLATMLTSDLARFAPGLKLIERSRIKKLLKEIAMGQSGIFTESTALEAGKLSGAKHIAFGSFMVIGDDVRLDVRVVEVETSTVVTADSIMGKTKQFMSLERRLAGKIAASLKATFQSPEPPERDSMDAALYFSRGVKAMDDGNEETAAQWFKKCKNINPDYDWAIQSTLAQP